jgi:hypothetical protein
MNKVIAIIITFALANDAWAANLAADDASDPAYNSGWLNGSNGGYGFGAWQLSAIGVAGHLIGDSTTNADGSDDGNVNGVAGDRDINTGSPATKAWGMFADLDDSATAIRPFTGGALNFGQTFSINFDNGFVRFGGRVAVSLLDSSSNPVFSVFFDGGTTHYQYSDSSGTTTTSIGYGDEGLRLEVTMTGPTNYTAKLTRFDSTNQTWSGAMTAAPEAFRAQFLSAGFPLANRFYINSMAIVPEPTTIALGAVGALGVALCLLRRRVVEYTSSRISPHAVIFNRRGAPDELNGENHRRTFLSRC